MKCVTNSGTSFNLCNFWTVWSDASSVMPERTRMEFARPVNFDNFVLKWWLRRIGHLHRCQQLRKLKDDLEKLGLSHRQVRRGLVQMATKSHVVLTRLPRSGRHGLKKAPVEKSEETPHKVECNRKTNIPFLEESTQQKSKNVQKSDFATTDNGRCNKQTENHNHAKISTCESGENSQRLSSLIRNNNVDSNKTEQPHPFDTALAQLDKLMCSKIDIHEKSTGNKKSSVSDVALADTMSKVQSKDLCDNYGHTSLNNKSSSHKKSPYKECDNKNSHVNNENDLSSQNSHELLADTVGAEPDKFLNSKRRHIKLNLSASIRQKERSVKIDCNKTSNTKEDSNADTCGNSTNSKKEISPNKRICLTPERDKNEVAVDINLLNLDPVDSRDANDNVQRKRTCEVTSQDCIQRRKKISVSIKEMEEINKRKRKKAEEKFRLYFGECISVSEDEQETFILHESIKRRRKKNSVDSCDSGVFIPEEGVTPNSCIEIVKEIQKVVPDSTVEEYREEASSKESTLSEDESVVETTESKTKLVDVTWRVDSPKNKIEDRVEKEELDSFNKESSEEAPQVNVTEICQSTVDLEDVTTSVQEAETSNNNIELLHIQETCSAGYNDETVTASTGHHSQLNTDNNLDSKEDLIELLRMNLDGTCRIVFDGNILTIEENVKGDVNQDVIQTDNRKESTFKEITTVELSSSHDANEAEQVENNVTENITPQNVHENENVRSVDVPTSNEIENDIPSDEVIILDDNVSSVPNDEDKCLPEKPVVNDTTEKSINMHPNVASQPRLRVLSSAELGSRWCPTPVGTAGSNIPQFSSTVNIVSSSDTSLEGTITPVYTPALSTQTIPTTIQQPFAPPLPPAPSSVQTPSGGNRNDNIRPDYQKAIRTVLMKIYKLIKYNRLIAADYNNYRKEIHDIYFQNKTMILRELETVGKLTNSRNYEHVVHCIINTLNQHLFKIQPLSFEEIYFYAPVHESLYYFKSRESATAAKSNPVQQNPPPPYSNTVSANQHAYHSQMPRKILPRNNVTGQVAANNTSSTGYQYIPKTSQIHANVTLPNSKDSNEKLREAYASKQRKRRTNNVSVNHAFNTSMRHQMNQRMQASQSTFSQNASYGHLAGKRTTTQNIHTAQNFVPQHAAYTPVPHKPVQQVVSNPVMNRVPPNEYVNQSVYTSQANTCYNMSMPLVNQPVRETINTPYTSTLHNVASTTNQQFQYIMNQQPTCNMASQMLNPPNAGQQTVQPSNAAQQTSHLPTVIQQPVQPANVVPQIVQPLNMVQQTVHSLNTVQQPVQSLNMAQQEVQPLNVTQQTIQPLNLVHQTDQPLNLAHQTVQPLNLAHQTVEPQSVIQQTVQPPHMVQPMVPPSNVTVLSQNAQQSTPLMLLSHTVQKTVPSYAHFKPQPVHVLSNTTQSMSNNVLHKENASKPVPTDGTQSPLSEIMKFTQNVLQSSYPTVNAPQKILLAQKPEITILKHLTAIQKIMLSNQIKCYFNYTTLLEPYFTVDQWNKIEGSRPILVHLEKVLNNCVQKALEQYYSHDIPITSVEQSGLNIADGAPETVPATVSQMQDLPNEIVVTEQHKSVNGSQYDVVNLQDSNILVQEQSESVPNSSRNSENTDIVEQTHESRPLQNEETQKRTENEEVPQQFENQTNLDGTESQMPEVVSVLEIEDPVSEQHVNSTTVNEEQLKTGEYIQMCLKSPSQRTQQKIKILESLLLRSADLEEQDNIESAQSNSHLVTVEISSNDDQVKVVDTNAHSTKVDTINHNNDEPIIEECKQQVSDGHDYSVASPLSSVKDTNSEDSTVPILNSDNATDCCETDVDDAQEELIISHIADVRSIPLDVFEKIGENDYENMESEIEEEECKVCLHCNKASTVLCEVCLEAHYCSKICSELHWEEHYKTCKPHALYMEYNHDLLSLQDIHEPVSLT